MVNHHDPDKLKKVKIGKLYEFDGLKQSGGTGSHHRLHRSHLRYRRYPYRRYHLLPGEPGGHSVPEDFRAHHRHAVSWSTTARWQARRESIITSRHLRDRLFRELNTDVSLRVEETDSTDSFKVSGRGELHLSVLIENMRREGYEFAVSKAEVLYQYDENGKKLEPMELAYIDVPDEFTGAVIEKLSQRKGELLNMSPANGGYTRLEFSIPVPRPHRLPR